PPEAFVTKSCAGAKVVSLIFRLDTEPSGEQLAAMVRRNYSQPADPGLRYRIPARMRVTVEEDGATIPAAETRLMIAQFGLVAALPATVDSKTINYSLKFYEATGALKSFKLGSKPVLTKGTVDSLSGNLNSILDAEKKKADADKLAADQLTKRQRMRQLL